MEKNTLKVKLFESAWTYILTAAIFFLFALFLFGWNRDWFISDSIIDNELFGQYGDFVGGVLGTLFALFSIILVVWTFRKQHETSTIQRFNDLFFELLKIYQEQILYLNEKNRTVNGNRYLNFFDDEKKQLQKSFVPENSFERNRNKILSDYMKFYVKYKNNLAICYRTLYRIYDLIDKSNMPESSKKNYLKIIRAQLTESELFFLRYNGMTYYGKGFVKYLNKYNVLKHLPTFELLEFKDWWGQGLDDEERTGIDIIFHSLRKQITKIIFSKPNSLLLDSARYQIKIQPQSRSDIKLIFTININSINNFKEFSGFEKFTPKRIQALFDCYLKEIFIYSNFEDDNVNNKEELEFYSDKILFEKDMTVITSGVRNNANNPLKIKYPIDTKIQIN